MKRWVAMIVISAVAFGLMQATLAFLTWHWHYRHSGEVEDQRLRSHCRYILVRLDWVLDEFQKVHQRYPADLAELMSAHRDFFHPRESETLESILDPWARPLVYRIPSLFMAGSPPRDYDLYSMGPNGQDDNMLADDIAFVE